MPTVTAQARITRAKKTLAAARVPFRVPPPEERGERLGSVLSVLYVIFTEGSTATSGRDLIRPDLAHEAVRVARVLAQGPAVALVAVDGLVASGALVGSHLLPSVLGELLTRLGRRDEARAELARAVGLCGNDRERRLLERKLNALP